MTIKGSENKRIRRKRPMKISVLGVDSEWHKPKHWSREDWLLYRGHKLSDGGLHPRPLPPSPVSKLSLFLSLTVCRCRYCLLSVGGGGKGGGGRAWSRIKPLQESLGIYKLFNPLCLPASREHESACRMLFRRTGNLLIFIVSWLLKGSLTRHFRLQAFFIIILKSRVDKWKQF